MIKRIIELTVETNLLSSKYIPLLSRCQNTYVRIGTFAVLTVILLVGAPVRTLVLPIITRQILTEFDDAGHQLLHGPVSVPARYRYFLLSYRDYLQLNYSRKDVSSICSLTDQ
jgi:hypothetical protein